MRVLLVKTSSMGDVIHALPAVTDAQRAYPDIQFDWVVEEGFSEIPAWHPAVDRVLPVAMRRWRKGWLSSRSEMRAAIQQIRQRDYDCVIDAQGLLKSAIFTRAAKGPRYGLDKASCREPLAARVYQFPVHVHRQQHAIARVRQLFAAALDYPFDPEPLAYGLQPADFSMPSGLQNPYLVFLHGTTWDSKHYPESYWVDLAALAAKVGFHVYLPWGNPIEKRRAEFISKHFPTAETLPEMPLNQLAAVLAHADGVIGVDSGLIHLAAALGVPGVTLYGSTSAELTGTQGPRQRCLQAEFECAPCMQKVCTYEKSSDVRPACYAQLPPEDVFFVLKDMVHELSSSQTTNPSCTT